MIIKSQTINKTIHITVSLCTVIWFLLAIQFVVADTGEAIPPDLLMRWHKVKAEAPDTGNVVELLDEGERIIQRLQELEDLRRNTEKPVSKGYYQRLTKLQERFKDLLFHIEMARLSTLSPEKITAMRTEYEEERIHLEEEVIALEDSILARGEIFLDSYRQKIALNHYMAKQEMIVDFIYRMAEIYYRRAEDQFFVTNDVSVFKPALEKYQRIIDEFPSSEYVDDALYNIAYVKNNSNLEEDRLEALTLYNTLIEKYRNSKFVPEAYWRVAEHNFYQKPPKYDEAIAYYSELERFPETSWYARGLYKIGWCNFTRANYPAAIEYFTRTVEVSLDGAGATEDIIYTNMLDEALEYTSVCFAQDSSEWAGSGVEAAVAFVQEDSIRSKTYGKRIIEYLGDIYKFQIGRYHQAIDAYQSYLTLYPMDENAPWVQEKIISCYAVDLRDIQPAYDEKVRIFAQYRAGTPWDVANPEPELRAKADEVVEKYYFRAINENIGRAIKLNDSLQLASSVEMSRKYLEAFPQGPNAYTVNYNLAILLDQHVAQSEQAYDEYIKVSRDYSEDKHRKEAAVNAAIIAHKLISKKGETPLDSLLGTSISESEQKYIDAVDNYIVFFPQGEEADIFLLNAGSVYYNHGDYDNAREYYRTLVSEFPFGLRRAAAYRYIMNSYFAEGNFTEAENVAKEIQAVGVDPELIDDARTRQAEATFLHAQGLKQDGDLLSAADEYRRSALETPDYEHADKALFESGLAYQGAKAWNKANKVNLLLVERYPRSELADKALYNVGYTSQSELEDKLFAAQTFRRLALEYPESDLAQDALRNASINFVEAEDWNGAIGANTNYVAMFPAAVDAKLFLFENAGLYLKLGNKLAANEIYAEYARKFPDDPRAVRARWERGKYLQDQGRNDTALTEFMAGIEAHRLLVAKGQIGEETYASRCLLQIIQHDYSLYESIDFAPASVVAEKKAEKLVHRERLFEHLEELNKLAKDEMFEGLYMVGKVEEELSRTFAEQTLSEKGRAEEKILTRETANHDAIEIAVRAMDAYAKSSEDIDKAKNVLRLKEEELESHKQELSQWLNEAQKAESQPPGVSDSTALLAGIDHGLEEVREAYNNGSDWGRRAREKIPELALRSAEIKFSTVQAFLDLPDVGNNSELKMLYRAGILSEFAVPRSTAVIELYRNAAQKATNSANEEAWKSRALDGVTNVFNTVDLEYKALNERSLESYARYYRIYQDLLEQGEGATTSGGLEAADLAERLVQYSDYSYNFAVTALNAQNVLLNAVEAGNEIPAEVRSRFVAAAIEEVLRVNDRYIGLASEANESKSRAETLSEQSVVWEDAVMTFEDCAYNFSGHQEEFLLTAMEFNRIHGNDKSMALRTGWALVALNREDHLSLLAEYGEERWIKSEKSFRVSSSFESGWSSLQFDDRNWVASLITDAGEGSGNLSGSMPIWIATEYDSLVCDSLYLRKTFSIDENPVAGNLWISVDGGYTLQLNGEFIGASEPGNGWTETASYHISQALKTGINVIAVMAIDSDSTTQGVKLALKYKVLPSQQIGEP